MKKKNLKMIDLAQNGDGSKGGSHQDKLRVGWTPSQSDIPIIKGKDGGTNNFRPVENTFNEEMALKTEKEILDYNDKIKNLNPLYSELTPLSGFIVRCKYIAPTRSPGGLIMPNNIKVKVPTQNGLGTLATFDSPYAYQRVAVIVATSNNYLTSKEGNKLTAGAKVQLKDTPLRAKSLGKDDPVAFLVNGFTHYSWTDPNPPTDITNEHFGYLLIESRDMEVILPETK